MKRRPEWIDTRIAEMETLDGLRWFDAPAKKQAVPEQTFAPIVPGYTGNEWIETKETNSGYRARTDLRPDRF